MARLDRYSEDQIDSRMEVTALNDGQIARKEDRFVCRPRLTRRALSGGESLVAPGLKGEGSMRRLFYARPRTRRKPAKT